MREISSIIYSPSSLKTLVCIGWSARGKKNYYAKIQIIMECHFCGEAHFRILGQHLFGELYVSNCLRE